MDILARFPTWRDWLFSIKAFAASMLALYIAMALGLPRPYWAMATVYVVAHPLTGATRSKGVYRVCGTLLGAGAAVALVPLLSNEPVLFSLAMSLWTGTLLYLALLDRTPRNYLFMLAAYSLPLIALPAVSAPDQVFDIAVARSEEILLGIVCASVVTSIVWPAKVTTVLGARVDAWLQDAAGWAADMLAPDAAPHASSSAVSRHQLAADILALDQFIGQLSYDADSAAVVRHARHLRNRLSMLLPLLSSTTDSLAALRRQPQGVPPELNQVMHELADWLARSIRNTPHDTNQPDIEPLLQKLTAQIDRTATLPAWDQLLATHVRTRLRSLIWLWQDCLALRRLISQGAPTAPWQARYQRWELDGKARHYDHGMLIFSALSTSLAIFVGCLIWIGTGWNDGGGAVIMGAIAACFFAAQDEPARSQRAFFIWNTVCMLLAAVLLFLVIPASHEFETLVMALAIPFLIVGTLATKPQFTIVAMTLTVSTASVMGLDGAYNANFPAFFNGNLASITGILFALIWTLLTRPFGAELALRRLVHASWADLARTAQGDHDGDYAELTARMLDRLNLLLPRLAASGDDQLTDGFSELRVGFSALDLQRDEHQLAAPADRAVHAVLQGLAQHYRSRTNAPTSPDSSQNLSSNLPQLGDAIDTAIRVTAAQSGAAAQEAIHALAELRLTLFPTRTADDLKPGGST